MDHNQLLAVLSDLLIRFEQNIQAFLPKLIGATVIFLVGLVAAYLIRWFARRLIVSLDRIIPSKKIRGSLIRLGMERPASEVFSRILFWLVLFFFLAGATETLGLPVVTTWISGVALYLPRLLAAALIGFAGLVAGVLLRDLVISAATSARIEYSRILGRLVQAVIVLVSVLIAADQLGVNIVFLTNILVVLIASMVLGAALAFGLGARTAVSNILSSYYLQKTYAVGHTVRIGQIEGEILQIMPTAVLLKTAEGQAMLPAKLFSETASILRTGGP